MTVQELLKTLENVSKTANVYIEAPEGRYCLDGVVVLPSPNGYMVTLVAPDEAYEDHER